MKKLILLLFIFSMPIFAQDSASVNIGKYQFRVDAIPVAVMIQASDEENTNLEANTFAGTGIGLSITRKGIFGLNISSLFYTGINGKIYPMVSGGVIVYPLNNAGLSLAWDFGKIERKFENDIQARLRLLISYNLNLLK